MEELIDQTRTTIRDFSKSVSKLNLYCDRLILEAEKGSVMSNQLNPVDEKLVIETTKAAIQLILRYDEYLTTQKQVEEKKKLLSDVDYPEYKTQALKTLETLKTDIVKLKLFQEYSNRTVESLVSARHADETLCTSSDNSYSFS